MGFSPGPHTQPSWFILSTSAWDTPGFHTDTFLGYMCIKVSPHTPDMYTHPQSGFFTHACVPPSTSPPHHHGVPFSVLRRGLGLLPRALFRLPVSLIALVWSSQRQGFGTFCWDDNPLLWSACTTCPYFPTSVQSRVPACHHLPPPTTHQLGTVAFCLHLQTFLRGMDRHVFPGRGHSLPLSSPNLPQLFGVNLEVVMTVI